MQRDGHLQVNSASFAAKGPSAFLNLAPVIFLLGVWPFTGSKIVMSSSQSVPAAKGVIHVTHDANNNVKLEMNVHYLAEPGSLTPPQGAYVTWIQVNDEAPQNKGELKIGKDRSGNLTIITPLKRFAIYVTAEQSAQVTAPTGERVLSANFSQ